MEDLQLVLFVLGAIAIIAVLVHGFWSIRKQNDKSLTERGIADVHQRSHGHKKAMAADGFEHDDVSEIKVRRSQRDQIKVKQEPMLNTAQEANKGPAPQFAEQEMNESLAAQQQLDLELSSEQAQSKANDAAENNDVETNDNSSQTQVHEETETAVEARVEEQESSEPQDVLVLHVVAKEGEVIQGTDLLPCLLTLNFKYGDMNIFHRHEDNAGTGKVLFSLANMVKPGIFDPDHMEQFTTHGVVLFISIPCHGDPLRNFSIMLNSAHQLADDLDAELLDGQRHSWTDMTKQDYLRRIKALAN